jgi:hypothetical protein
VTPVFFANDPYQTDLEAFLSAFAGSDVWKATTSEYGVGALTVEPSIVVTDPAPALATRDDIAAWLAQMADGTHAGWPKASIDHVFSIFYPSTSVIGLTPTVTSCTSLLGFHGAGALADATPLTYTAIARCPKYVSLTGLDAVTPVAAHELIEAATDPLPDTKPAFKFPDVDHKAWTYLSDENADWCTTSTPETAIQIGKYWAQRSWSNQAAAAFHDPCVPAPSHAYVVAAPALEDVTLAGGDAGDLHTKGLVVPSGTSRTVDVGIFADGPIDSVTVHVTTKNTAALSFAWDRTKGKPGDVLRLTITMAKTFPPTGWTTFAIWAQTGGADDPYPILVKAGP